MIISKAKTGSPEEILDDYESQTSWSDFRLSTPLLFIYLHGLEVYMKALLERTGSNSKKTKTHKLSQLLQQVKSVSSIPNSITDILSKHISDQNPFHRFFNDNCISVDRYYEILKYPESTKKEEFDYTRIRFLEELGIEKYNIIQQDLEDLRLETMKWIINGN